VDEHTNGCRPAELKHLAPGTVMQADTLRGYAADAGFAAVDILEIDHPQFRLHPLG
jgi:hypothetical protein